MALNKAALVRELKHQINSPLAAIRNALYLAAVRASDPEVERYLKLADAETSRITMALDWADQATENKGLYISSPQVESRGSVPTEPISGHELTI